MTAAQTVFIVDDDEAVRESLTVLVQAEGLRAQAFPSAEAFLAGGAETASGCLIVDIHMPGLTGLELQAELIRRHIGLPVIVITGQGDVPKAVAALKAGAVDFLEKPYNVEALLRVVREALDRAGRLDRLDAALRDIDARRGLLSPREREVMALMVAGHPNKVIGTTLGISPRTVENHRASVMEKMQCDNLSALIHLILRLDQSPP
jgi:FixJ family two-component response regulator